jgi:hypothetical protein
MQVPPWAKNGQNTFWRRHYELATITEQACEQALEQQLQKWLRELERTDGPAAQEQPRLSIS